MSVACVVVAAGASTRLGRPKQLLAVGGPSPLVRAAAQSACGAGCDRIAVVVGAYWASVVASLDALPVDIVHGVDWREGMAASIRAATFFAIGAGASALMLCVCDQPYLSARHLRTLLAASENGAELTASYYANKLGVPAVFPERYFGALLALRGDRGGAGILRGSPTTRSVSFPEGAIDIDAPSDLAALLRC